MLPLKFSSPAGAGLSIPRATPTTDYGELMDAVVYSWHGGTLNSRRAASPLVWLVEGEERWEVPGHPQGFLPLNWGGT
ncbi:hypothetical protein TNCV_258741 [Trichonephila clavipes]|uniref:Uncharacterized protein n=1 Tax=Trichonephila clavipes TaxID=2585209 RepID=A0A8X6RQC8_TRICX|nr:hypothetical protein TNCV_258741 [Trichonephila clavipes]